MDRRQLLQMLSLAPLAAAVPITREAAKVTLSGLETFRLNVNRRGDWVIARTLTNSGITGLGDASHSGSDSEVISLLRQFVGRCRGRSVFDIAWLHQRG